MTKAAAIVSGAVTPGAALPESAVPFGAEPKETPVIPELKEAQRALAVSDDGKYGPITRGAIREFQTGMFRRNPREWPVSDITGNLTSRSGRVLPTLKPMPTVFMSPFERAYLGSDGGLFSDNPLSTIDPERLTATLMLLRTPDDQMARATTTEARLKLLRERIAKLREDFKLSMDKGAVLDAALFKAVWKDSPLNVDKTD